MLQLARRGHTVEFFGFPGARRYLRLRERRGRPEPTGNLRFSNLPHSPYVRIMSGIRGSIAAWSLRRHTAASRQHGSIRIVWLYHPLLLGLAERLPRECLVYDVMDQFSAFRKTHPKLENEEQRLLDCADMVFTGGRSLDASTHEAGRPLTYCFPSGVDLGNFGSAARVQPAAELRHFRRPIFGYIGAVDERIDFKLIRELARLRPRASIVLVGPLLLEPEVMPNNVFFLGARPYADLPRYLAAFDCCLLPFDVSKEVVQQVSPTKTPECLAAGRPVVSTPIPDVVQDWAGVVSIGANAYHFARACDDYVDSPPSPESLRAAVVQRARTWEQIAAEMESLILAHQALP